MGKYESEIFNCPLDAALQAIGGKWKGIILFHLARGKMRFNELQKSIGKVTERMLIRQLRELERENPCHKRYVADQALDLMMAKDVIEGRA